MPPPRNPLKLFLIYYLCAVTLFTGLVEGALLLYAGPQLDALKSREVAKLEIARSTLLHHVEAARSDLMTLTRAPSLQALVEHRDAPGEARVAGLFVALAGEKRFYDQIRYLDEHGMERVRVDLRNGVPVSVPDAELQDKSGRYFFKDTIALRPGEIYLSPLDLNIERGRIEEPYKPMLRIGTPVFDSAGQCRGIVILNLYGSVLLDRFRQIMGRESPAQLLNRDGDWLVAPDPAREWGFMFGRDDSLARRDPALWQALNAGARGHWVDSAGLHTYTTVYPLQRGQQSASGSALPAGSSAQPLHGEAYYWKLVSSVPAAALPSTSLLREPRMLVIYGGGLLLLLALCAFLARGVAMRSSLRSELLRSALRHKEITDNLGEGLVVLDARGRVTTLNPEAERLLGWSAGELLGQEAHGLFHRHPEGGLPAERCPIRQVVVSGEVYRSEEERFWRRDGSSFPAGVIAAPLSGEHAGRGIVLAFRDITELKRQQAEIFHLAYHDPLTGLPNRRLLLDRLELALGLARRHGRELALMFLDLDHFKQINDTHGHDGGDELLRGVAERLQQAVRGSDTVSRQGGDEFVILLPEIGSAAQAEQTARRILQLLREPVAVKGTPLAVGVSIGIAFCPGDAETVDALLLEADAAMYAAKQAGRNRYCLRGRATQAL